MKKSTFLFVVVVHLGFILISCSGRPPKNPGLTGGRLRPCPGSPNCVSSQAEDEKHFIEPITYSTVKTEAYEKIKAILLSLERTSLVEKQDNYLRATCKSRIMKFTDDIEFYFPEEKIIHVRSASRLGYSDFGANRKRMEKIRRMFENM